VNGDDGGVANGGGLVKTRIYDSGFGSNRKEKGVTVSTGGVIVVLDRMRLCRLDPRVDFEWNVLGDPAPAKNLSPAPSLARYLYRRLKM
jgi:hypothetical protein